MNTSVKLLFDSLDFGESVIVENLISVPIVGERFTSLNFLTLNEAIDAKVIQVLEKDINGSVPELLVKNLGDIPVLMLDGEEVKGAKQNRVLNTTILIKENSATVIPVSCTEQGRWSYDSERMDFASSDVIMNSASRHKKMASVSVNLRDSNVAVSDQCGVWDSVSELHRKSGTHSDTGAMFDAFSEMSKDIDDYLDAIKLIENQIGCFMFLNDKILGFDILPCNDSYSKYHNKLIKSYIIDAIANRDKKAPSINHNEKAKSFIKSLIDSNETSHDSAGYGLDYRYDRPDAVGSALVVDEVVVHSAFFALDNKKQDPDMHSYSNRRRFRME